MSGYGFTLAGALLEARASGALYWPGEEMLIVSDLHLGKSERIARRGGGLLPPYDTRDCMARLEGEIEACAARTVVCLGDSFDDLAAARAVREEVAGWLARLQAGRRWVWIEGNHDPGPVDFGGAHLAELPRAPLTFRHIAIPGVSGEVSGHYHPKAALRAATRPCFLVDSDRVILPAFGSYTGGMRTTDPVLSALMRPEALAVLTGPRALPVPMPRRA